MTCRAASSGAVDGCRVKSTLDTRVLLSPNNNALLDPDAVDGTAVVADTVVVTEAVDAVFGRAAAMVAANSVSPAPDFCNESSFSMTAACFDL